LTLLGCIDLGEANSHVLGAGGRFTSSGQRVAVGDADDESEKRASRRSIKSTGAIAREQRTRDASQGG
jgi:hypothetical protein